MTVSGLITAGGSALVTASGAWLVTGTPSRYQFLKDHSLGGEYIQAGEIADDYTRLPTSWVPSVNVEPLNAEATQAYYDAGPIMGAVIRTQWHQLPITRPVTYWYEVEPNYWALTGLGSDQGLYPPIFANIGRVE